jgi:hypothetical protein
MISSALTCCAVRAAGANTIPARLAQTIQKVFFIVVLVLKE